VVRREVRCLDRARRCASLRGQVLRLVRVIEAAPARRALRCRCPRRTVEQQHGRSGDSRTQRPTRRLELKRLRRWGSSGSFFSTAVSTLRVSSADPVMEVNQERTNPIEPNNQIFAAAIRPRHALALELACDLDVDRYGRVSGIGVDCSKRRPSSAAQACGGHLSTSGNSGMPHGYPRTCCFVQRRSEAGAASRITTVRRCSIPRRDGCAEMRVRRSTPSSR